MDSSETHDRVPARVGPAAQAQTEGESIQEFGCPVCNNLVRPHLSFSASGNTGCLPTNRPSEPLPINSASAHFIPGSLPLSHRRGDSASATRSYWSDCPPSCRVSRASLRKRPARWRLSFGAPKAARSAVCCSPRSKNTLRDCPSSSPSLPGETPTPKAGVCAFDTWLPCWPPHRQPISPGSC